MWMCSGKFCSFALDTGLSISVTHRDSGGGMSIYASFTSVHLKIAHVYVYGVCILAVLDIASLNSCLPAPRT